MAETGRTTTMGWPDRSVLGLAVINPLEGRGGDPQQAVIRRLHAFMQPDADRAAILDAANQFRLAEIRRITNAPPPPAGDGRGAEGHAPIDYKAERAREIATLEGINLTEAVGVFFGNVDALRPYGPRTPLPGDHDLRVGVEVQFRGEHTWNTPGLDFVLQGVAQVAGYPENEIGARSVQGFPHAEDRYAGPAVGIDETLPAVRGGGRGGASPGRNQGDVSDPRARGPRQGWTQGNPGE